MRWNDGKIIIEELYYREVRENEEEWREQFATKKVRL